MSDNVERMGRDGRRALIAAFGGFTIDMFDVFLPIIVMGPALSYFEPKGLSPVTSTTLYYLVFALSLIGRPLGSFIFGHFGDKLGRRKATLTAVLGCSIVTFLIALLPGYATWGLTGIILLAILRLIDGVFLGGEYTGATPLAMEYSPRAKRGVYGGFINSGYPAAMVLISLIMMLMIHISPEGGPTSPYAVWGWRIPFIFGALISFALYLYYLKIPESKVWKQSDKTEAPLKTLFKGESLKRLSTVFVVMSGVWYVLNGVISAMPGILSLEKVSTGTTTMSTLYTNIALWFLFVFAGALSQKIGRRAALMLIGVLTFTIAPYLYYELVAHADKGAGFVTVMIILVNVLTIPVYGVLTAYITEMFQTSVRASGYGIGYSLAIVIPSFSSFIMLFLKHFMPYQYTGIVITVLGGLLIAIGGLISPDTRGAEFVPNKEDKSRKSTIIA